MNRPQIGVSLGQNCLADTAYNTRPSSVRSDSISAVAALSMADGNVIVTPYGGTERSALEFTVTNGRLVPTPQTANTLRANGCLVEDGITTGPRFTSYGAMLNDKTYLTIGPVRPEEHA